VRVDAECDQDRFENELSSLLIRVEPIAVP
jgi:hypothetical protein